MNVKINIKIHIISMMIILILFMCFIFIGCDKYEIGLHFLGEEECEEYLYLTSNYNFSVVLPLYLNNNQSHLENMYKKFDTIDNSYILDMLSNPVQSIRLWFDLPEETEVTDYAQFGEGYAILEYILSESTAFYITMRMEEGIYFPGYISTDPESKAQFDTYKEKQNYLNSLTDVDIENAVHDIYSYNFPTIPYERRLYLIDEAGDCEIYGVPDVECIVFRINKQIYYDYVSWHSPSFSFPRIEEADYDRDGDMEYFLICTSKTGTGTNIEDFYYIDVENGEFSCKLFDHHELRDFLDSNIKLELETKNEKTLLTLLFNRNQKWALDLSDFAVSSAVMVDSSIIR